MIAPTSLQKLAHPEGLDTLAREWTWNIMQYLVHLYFVLISGEIATARAAAASNTIMVLVYLGFIVSA